MSLKKISSKLLFLNRNSLLKYNVRTYDYKEDRGLSPISLFFDSYGTVDLTGYLTIEIKEENAEWDPSRSIMITERNIYQFLKGLKQFIDNFYKKDTFEISEGKTIITRESIAENSVDIYISKGNVVRLSPAVIYDPQEDIYYEGAIIYLNKAVNSIEVHYTIIEALYRAIDKVDFPTYTMNFYRFFMENLDEENKKKFENEKLNSFKPIIKKKSIFNEEPESTVKEETSSSTIDRSNPMDDFFK